MLGYLIYSFDLAPEEWRVSYEADIPTFILWIRSAISNEKYYRDK